MQHSVEFIYEAACALDAGRRDQQEDALAADFPLGSGLGFVVLADGMGGHAAGDIASKIVVTEIFSELKMLADDPIQLEQNIQQLLQDAVVGANCCVEQFVKQNPDANGMGATLVAPVLFANRLYWISVGDSPLFLFRDGHLSQINENHSMAAQIDKMCREGRIGNAEAAEHPDRQCLTSAIAGHDIPQIDCIETPMTVRDGDVIVAASDGLQFLSDDHIAQVLIDLNDRPSAEISAAFLSELKALDHPEQDNVSLCVIKIRSSDSPMSEDGQLVHKHLPESDGTDAGNVDPLTALNCQNGNRPETNYRISTE